MAGAEPAAEATDAAPRWPLAESALYREGELERGHAAVWGSWYDTATHRWGYKCCRALDRGAPCAASADAPGNGDLGGAVTTGSAATTQRKKAVTGQSIDEVAAELKIEVLPVAGGKPAAPQAASGMSGLVPREECGSAADFVLGWARAALQEWRRGLKSGDAQLAASPRFGSPEHLAETERGLAPLLRILESEATAFHRGDAVHVWSVGNNKWMRDGRVLEILPCDAVVRGSLTPADGMQLPAGSVLVFFDGGQGRKWVQPGQLEKTLRKGRRADLGAGTLEKMEQIAQLSSERRYDGANQAYMELTLGHGRWHGEVNITGMTGCAKAPRNGLSLKADKANILDTEEAKGYVLGLKRLVALLQTLRP